MRIHSAMVRTNFYDLKSRKMRIFVVSLIIRSQNKTRNIIRERKRLDIILFFSLFLYSFLRAVVCELFHI